MVFRSIRKHPKIALTILVVLACLVPIVAPRFDKFAKTVFNPEPPVEIGPPYAGKAREKSYVFCDAIQYNYTTENYEIAFRDNSDVFAKKIVIMDRKMNSIVAIQNQYSSNLTSFRSQERPAGIEGLSFVGSIADGNEIFDNLEQRVRESPELRARIGNYLKWYHLPAIENSDSDIAD